MPIRVAIVDDKPQNRFVLSEQLKNCKNINVIFSANNGIDFLDKMKSLDSREYPQVTLMDIEMPGMDGIETVARASVLYPGVYFLMLTVFDDEEKIFEAIKSGANGYLLKDEKVSVIEDYIEQIVEIGGVPMSPSIARKAMNMLVQAKDSPVSKIAEPAHELTERELEVLKLLVNGYDYKIIAEKLFLSSHTVRKHIANIYNKLHVKSKAQVINLAHNKRWFQ